MPKLEQVRIEGSNWMESEIMADHGIKGKTVLIAGGGKNLGGLLARDLAQHGARAVAIHYNSASSAAEADLTVAAIKEALAAAAAAG